MKKKLEAELISIAHRILKLKNRAEIDQLQQETLKLYEKLSVLKFVEDNFNDVKPTIGYASAEGKLEEIYNVEVEPESADASEEVKEAVPAVKEEDAPVVTEAQDEPEGEAVIEAEVEDEAAEEVKEEEQAEAKEPEAEEIKEEEPDYTTEVVKTEEEIEAIEEGAEAVYEKEQDSTEEEEEQAADAEMMTIAPEEDVEVQKSGIGFELAFERKAAPEESNARQIEVSFEDFHSYEEPEFVRKDTDAPAKEDVAAKDDWMNWEPKKDTPAVPEQKQEEPKAVEQKEEPKAQPEESKPAAKSLNDALGKTINIGLNDRIAFEKHLFGGSGEDLNRVLSQLNTMNTFKEAKNFVEDLVKPDYNNWKGKEEYEERFMGLVEKKFD